MYHPSDPKVAVEHDVTCRSRTMSPHVISKRGDVQWKELGPAREIDHAVTAFRQALRDPNRRDVTQLARALDEKLMRPVRALLNGANQLLISPDAGIERGPLRGAGRRAGSVSDPKLFRNVLDQRTRSLAPPGRASKPEWSSGSGRPFVWRSCFAYERDASSSKRWRKDCGRRANRFSSGLPWSVTRSKRRGTHASRALTKRQFPHS